MQDSTYDDDKSIEDQIFELEVNLNRLSFQPQYHYGMFYAYVKLKEQEIRNIVWIAECISQAQRGRMSQYINIFWASCMWVRFKLWCRTCPLDHSRQMVLVEYAASSTNSNI